jgi:hypothetical protein
MAIYVDELGVVAHWPSQFGESEPEEEEEEGFEHLEEEHPLVNDDAQQNQPTSKKKATAGKTKTRTRWNCEMNSQLASSVRIKRPYMKENTNIGREDVNKVWSHIQQGLLTQRGFASGVSVQACKKKFWELYKTFKTENARLETVTGNLPEEYGPYEQDMVQIMKEYEPKRQSQEDAKAVEAAKLAKAVRSETPQCGVAVVVVRVRTVRNPKSALDTVGHQQPLSRICSWVPSSQPKKVRRTRRLNRKSAIVNMTFADGTWTLGVRRLWHVLKRSRRKGKSPRRKGSRPWSLCR